MIAVENLGRLEIFSSLPYEKTMIASIKNVRPIEPDSDLYDICIAIANLRNGPVSTISLRLPICHWKDRKVFEGQPINIPS